jgi:DnaJ domain
MAGRVRTREWSGIDYYRELGVAPGAARSDIDEAYRRLAKAWHPDRNPDAEAEDRFKRVTAAYEVLSNPATRAAYDDFRFRVDAGRLGSSPPPPWRDPPSPTGWTPPTPRPARRRPRRQWKMPDRLRIGIGVAMLVLAAASVLWTLFGDLPRNTAGDTVLAVQVTLWIMAAKLAGGAYVVIKYPQLRARWHHPPPVRPG